MVVVQRLEAGLRRAVSGEVRFDAGARAAYAADASNYRQVPIGVLLPRTVEDIVTSFAKKLAGVVAERTLPRFAAKTFRAQFKANGRGERVVLFDDTFNNHFRPQTALAAQRVLETAGCAVELPRARLCCGRPYYDFGMLERAKRALERVLRVLAPQLDAGLPVVVLEPGCLSVFRDELAQLFPDDPRAGLLASRVTSLAEFLQNRNFSPAAPQRVVMHSTAIRKRCGEPARTSRCCAPRAAK